MRTAALGWVAAWLVGAVLSSLIFSLSGAPRAAEAGPVWLLLAQLGSWLPVLAMLHLVARRTGARTMVARYALRWRPVDLLGVPIGVFAQLVLVWLVYLPLRAVWPDTFRTEELERHARELWASAHGAGVLLLVFVVAVGAPLVEELLYRGLLQGSAVHQAGAAGGVIVVALWFAVIHFQTISIPGLFVVGLVLGVCTLRTQRLGMAVLVHVAFNATGLAVVALR